MLKTILVDYWPVIVVVLQGMALWVQWSFKKQFVSKEDLKAAIDEAMDSTTHSDGEIEDRVKSLRDDHQKLHERVTENIDKRLLRIEEGIKHMPKHEDLTRLHKRMDEINTQLQQIAGSMNGYGHTLRLIEQHLLNGNQKP